MNWYYVEEGKQAGPVDDAQLDGLRASNKISADTLVWREGLANWVPYSEAKGEAIPAGGLPPAAGQAELSSGNLGEPTEAVCTECGGIFAKDDMIRYGNAHVCANCKPVFMQKLAEGVQIKTGDMRYAGFWIRFAAKFIDGLIMRVIATPIGFAVGLATHPATSKDIIVMEVLAGTAGFLATMAYTVWMTGKYGATLGKMACKIKIVTAEGGQISYARAFGRFFAEILSGCPTLMIGYIMVAFDDQKRSLHDRICNTRVIYK